MTVRIKLLELLQTQGISQRELVRLSGVHYPAINEMCNNKVKYISLQNLGKICNTLKCNVHDIIELELK